MDAFSISVVMLRAKEFAKLIAIALLIAVPVAWVGLNKWLDTYPIGRRLLC